DRAAIPQCSSDSRRTAEQRPAKAARPGPSAKPQSGRLRLHANDPQRHQFQRQGGEEGYDREIRSDEICGRTLDARLDRWRSAIGGTIEEPPEGGSETRHRAGLSSRRRLLRHARDCQRVRWQDSVSLRLPAERIDLHPGHRCLTQCERRSDRVGGKRSGLGRAGAHHRQADAREAGHEAGSIGKHRALPHRSGRQTIPDGVDLRHERLRNGPGRNDAQHNHLQRLPRRAV
ncbi:MAG: hypothetical protein AVDCRST_MAG42-2210, partial [uncultured Chthoniobacterales bacterium]